MLDETTVAKATEYAAELGRRAGVAAASWYIDGNTSEDTLLRILNGIEEGDPEVLGTFPTPNLSGEWAGDPTPTSVLEDITDEIDEDIPVELEDELLNAWEDAAWSAVQDEIQRMATAMLGEE